MDNNANSFFSIDHLLEFGLSMAVARQMIGTMNQAMTTMMVPGSAANPYAFATPAPTTIYVALDGRQAGPYAISEFMALVRDGRVTKDTLAWMPGMRGWTPVKDVPEILKYIAMTPPALGC